jgi:hypothetical protein
MKMDELAASERTDVAGLPLSCCLLLVPRPDEDDDDRDAFVGDEETLSSEAVAAAPTSAVGSDDLTFVSF